MVMDKIQPVLSVCMVTYNHEKWIGQAIEAVLKQETVFPIELVIGEDCSTDNTAAVIKTYAEKNKNVIVSISNKKNLGLAKNFSQLLNHCKGKYVAICEGDDFWTDIKKLQKQVDFLESSPGHVLCSHNCSRLIEQNGLLIQNIKYNKNFSFDQEMSLNEWFTQPLTCVFKNLFREYTQFNKEDMFCDVIFFYELLKHGDGYFMADNMATFRVVESALSSGLSRWQWNKNHVIMYDYLFRYNKRDLQLQKISANYCLVLYVHNLQQGAHKEYSTFKPLKEYLKRTPQIYHKIFTLVVRVPFFLIKHGLFHKLTSAKS